MYTNIGYNFPPSFICRYHAAFSPDGSLLCVLYEEAATLWDADQNALLRVLSVPSPSLRNSPLRRVVFGGGRKREELYVYVYVRCVLCVVCCALCVREREESCSVQQ